MVIKSSRFSKTVLTVVMALSLLFSTQLSCFAAGGYVETPYKYNENYEIVGLTTDIFNWSIRLKGEVTIPAKATGIKSKAFKNNSIPIIDVSQITKVIIPKGVNFIEGEAFTKDCKLLKEVVIQNSKSNVNVAGNAFPVGVVVTYTIEETTRPPEPTKPPVTVPETTMPPLTQSPPATQAPTTTTRPSKAQTPGTTKKPNTTKKSGTTNSKTETKISSTNKNFEEVTEPANVEITNPKVPLAEIENNGYPEELDSWNSIVNASAQKQGDLTKKSENQSKKGGSKVASYAVGASVSVAAFAGVIFAYFKFKK